MNQNAIYLADVTPLYEEERFLRLYSLLPSCRRAKIDSLRQPKDKCLSLGAGLLLRHATAMAGCGGAEEELVLGPYGKPSFSPSIPFHFNLSHSGTKVLCAFSSFPVGCDIERVRDRALGVSRKVFSDEEQKLLATSEDKAFTFTTLWCRRESLLKLTGTGFAANERNVDHNQYAFLEGQVEDYVYAVCQERGATALFSAITEIDFCLF